LIVRSQQATPEAGCFFENFDALCPDLCRDVRQARDVSAWAREAGDELEANRIGDDGKDDWDFARGTLRRDRGWPGDGDQNVDIAGDKRVRIGIEPLVLFRGIGVLEQDGSALDVTEIAEALPQGDK
jgi:hypothetical protein